MDSTTEAMEWVENLDKMVATAAAERNFQDRNMSEKAREESKQAEDDNFGHLAVIPEKPKRKYTRKQAS
jgi:hypothetical protein